MLKYIIKRILQVIPMLLLISFIVFSLIYIAPFDVVDSMTTPNMTQEQIDLLREKSGLNQPFLVQYFAWLQNIVAGNFGKSLVTQQSVLPELLTRIPNTMILVIPAYLTAILLAIILGLVASAYKGTWIDKLIDGIASFGIAIPTFWFAMILIYILGYQLNIFEIVGMYTVGQERTFGNFLSHFVMPYLTLTVNFFPRLLRYVRASAMQQLTQDYVSVQKAYQASKFTIFAKHISRHVMIPVVTQLGLALPMMVTGAIITETVFSWPGVGPYLMTATRGLDYPVIMAVMLLSSTLVILGNLLADILYFIVDPRIRREGR
ncbi:MULTISPECIES: ABC transporter permease [unclassified Granulicatella]|uniref:ABC transporter permease n=1 Tax=unclassified Granulicatella TaxID=2630493 RepID=UPI001072F284|nr:MULTISPECIES: ABC transporter permease [unclassified Granulicatella]MBF0779934.1 ABC transporter permease [Granulicatella sp. 19428wC4_WM01]TFU96045.1 ABC transporter permease [Granulicatella sp. WM01]